MTASETAPAWPTRDEWRDAGALVLATRGAFWLVAWAAQWFLGNGRGRLDVGVSHWRRWDADIYAKIAEHGYTGPGAEPWSEAFPPLWPLLLRAVSATGVSPTVAALTLTTLACIVAVAYLIRLVDEEGGPVRAVPTGGRRAGLYLLLFPTAVFLVAGYAEALFLAGAIPAFREARRGRWARVALPAAVAVGARWTGLFLLVGLAVEALARARAGDRREELLPAAGALAVATVPLVAYGAWLSVVHGDVWYVLTAQRKGWGRTFVGPVDSLRATWNAAWPGAASEQASAIVLAWRIELLAAALGLALLVVLLRRRDRGYAAYVGSALAVMLTSSWYYSVPRTLLVLFPLVIVLAGWSARREGRHELVLAVLAPLATLGVVVFTAGGWFF